eukprot:jgi/Tetstr1/420852/TSEL_011925.t1
MCAAPGRLFQDLLKITGSPGVKQVVGELRTKLQNVEKRQQDQAEGSNKREKQAKRGAEQQLERFMQVETRMDEQGAAITQHRAVIERLHSTSEKQDAITKQQDGLVAQLESRIQEQDSLIEELDTRAKQQDILYKQHDDLVKEMETRISALEDISKRQNDILANQAERIEHFMLMNEKARQKMDALLCENIQLRNQPNAHMPSRLSDG